MSDSPTSVPFWRDTRVLQIAVQVAAVGVAIAVVSVLVVNLSRNLERLGVGFGLGFLDSRASFDISETPIAYSADDTYQRALVVGFVNSLRVAIAGLVLATLVGVTVGIARLSENWLVRNLARLYVEVLRNLPLLLHLLFWYFVVFLSAGREARALPFGAFANNTGAIVPWVRPTPGTGLWAVLLLGGSIAAVWLWRWRVRVQIEQGTAGRPLLWAGGAIAASAAIAAAVTRTLPLLPNLPQMTATGVVGGLRLSPEYAALLAGLTFYTAAFIAEIVRAGIQSVPKGQWEAARSLGLKSGLAMRLVVFPQALRVIVPPLNSEYLNLWKNSSLAIAIGFPDVYFVASTTFNQTGRAVEMMLLIVVVYLAVGLVISTAMNLFNRAISFG